MADEAVTEEAPKKKGKKKLFIIVGAVVLVGGIGAGLTMGGGAKKTAKGGPATTTTVTFPELGTVTLDKVTTSLPDNTIIQFDLGVRVVTKKPGKGELPAAFLKDFKPETFKADEGIIGRSAASDALSAMSHQDFASAEGQKKAKDAVEAAVKAAYKGYVDEVFVNGFIVQ